MYFETDQIISSGYGRIDQRPTAKFQCDEQLVPVTTLDAFAAENGIKKVGFIKLDIEGAEKAAIEGMTGVLSGRASRLYSTEVATKSDETCRDRYTFGDVLSSYRLRAYRVSRELVPVDYRQLPAGKQFNLLWVHKDVAV